MYNPDFIKILPELHAISESEGGIQVECNIAHKYNERTDSHIFSIVSLLYNSSELKISTVGYAIDFLDEEGNVLYSDPEEYYGFDHALFEKNEHRSGFQKKFESEPVKIEIKIKYIKDTDEAPLCHLPLKGEYLYQALNDEHLKNILEDRPVKVIINRGSIAGISQEKITDKEKIDQIVEAFCRITIIGPSATWVTDNDNGLFFEFADGAKAGVRFNMNNLELHIHNRQFCYEVKDNYFFIPAGYTRQF
ncbi:MAG: hypothetical protein IJI92_07565 [Erysipelotrichaceae bacterium]|nr:hypothetical protein [Erysipelotrichaceae bacterium]